MTTKSDTDDNETLYDKALSLFSKADALESENKERFRQDFKFIIDGIQWDDSVKMKRAKQRRPALTNNILKPLVRKVINQTRSAKPSIRVKPVDSKSDPQVATLLEGLIRNIEYSSKSDIAYDTAAEHALIGGFGYIRVDIDYPDEDSWDMEVLISPVRDPLNVFVPSSTISYDGSEWNDVFVLFDAPEEDYEGKTPFQKRTSIHDSCNITLCEWFHRTFKEVKMLLLNDGTSIEADLYKEDEVGYVLAGAFPVKSRTMKKYTIMRYILDGTSIIEETEFPGSYIPIIPVYGESYSIDGKNILKGLLSDAKDSQMHYNILRSSSAEIASLSPKVPFVIGKGGAVDESKWAQLNDPSLPYVEYDYSEAIQGPIPLARDTASATVQGQISDVYQDIHLITGTQPLSADSVKTDSFIQRKKIEELGTYHFIDNLARAIRQVGKVVVSVIPYIYEEDRIARITGEDGQEGVVSIPKWVGKYDVTVEAGDNHKSKMEDSAAILIEALRVFPEGREILAPALLENMTFNGSEKIKAKLEQLMNPPQEQAGPSLDQQILMKQAQNDQTRLQVEQQRIQLDIEKLKLDNKKIENDYIIRQAEWKVKDDNQTLKEHVAGVEIASKLFNDTK